MGVGSRNRPEGTVPTPGAGELTDWPAVIPVAGRGTRLSRLTRTVSKELLAVGDDVVLSHILAELEGAGVRDVLLVSREDKPDIAAYVDRITRAREFDLRIRILHQGPVPGNGGAILTAAECIGERPFIVVWGDEIFLGASRAGQLIDAYRDRRAPTICLCRVPDREVPKCGMAEGVELGGGAMRIGRILEKPRPEETASRWASVGGMVLEPSVVERLRVTPPSADGEVYLSTALDSVARTGTLFGVMIDARWFETGSYEGYARAFTAVARARGLVT